MSLHLACVPNRVRNLPCFVHFPCLTVFANGFGRSPDVLVSAAMIQAAQAAEFDYFKTAGMSNGDRFIGTSKTVICVMIEAALRCGAVSAICPPKAEKAKRSGADKAP
jgi:hypothetical protein